MKRSGVSKMNPFFLECVVSLALLSLVGLVILKAFVKVERVNARSQAERQAVVMMCSIAEYIQAEKPEVPQQMSWYYNALGEVLEAGEVPSFEAELTKVEQFCEGGVLESYTVHMYSQPLTQKQEVGRLEFACYRPKGIQQVERRVGYEN
ncbi:MAG: hypothetical protein ACRCW2_12545 [Cellulosilyticaceae bacterium]